MIAGLFFSGPAVSQTDNEEPAYEYTYDVDDDDFAPGLFVMVLISFGIMVVLVGAGIVLAGLAILVILLLIALGVFSASIAVGIHQQSFESGFKTLVVLGSSIAGGMAGMLIAWFGNVVLLWWPLEQALLVGGVGGLAGGVVFGILATLVIRRITRYVSLKYASYKQNRTDEL